MNFLLAVNRDAITAMGWEARSWRIVRRSDKSLDDLARIFQQHGQVGPATAGASKSMLYPFLRRINEHQLGWAVPNTSGYSDSNGERVNRWRLPPSDPHNCLHTGAWASNLTAGRSEPLPANRLVIMLHGTRADADALWDEVRAAVASSAEPGEAEAQKATYIHPSKERVRVDWRQDAGTDPQSETPDAADLLRRLNPALHALVQLLRHGVSSRAFGYGALYAF